MRTQVSQVRLIAALGGISLLAVFATFAEDPTKEQATTSTIEVVDGVVSSAPAIDPAPAAAPVQTSAPKPETAAAPKLAYGVEDVLKLSRAQVSEDITVSFIQTSGTIYDLRPNDIVYLKEQGVSDKVLNAMIDQRKKAMEVAAQAAASAAQVEAALALEPATPGFTTPVAPAYADTAAPIYIEPAADYVPASTLYVIPYPAAAYAYYNYSRPFYGGYRYYGVGYCAPSTVYRFGCGSRAYTRSCFRR